MSDAIAAVSEAIQQVHAGIKRQAPLLSARVAPHQGFQQAQDELRSCEASLRTLSAALTEKETRVQQLRVLHEQCTQQNASLRAVTSIVQQRLPGSAALAPADCAAVSSGVAAAQIQHSNRGAASEQQSVQSGAGQAASATVSQTHDNENESVWANAIQKRHDDAAPAKAPVQSKTTAHKGVPRRYITNTELATCSSYMRGRMTVAKVNAALDEFAGYAEHNARLMATYRKKNQALSAADRDKALDISRVIAAHPGMKTSYWFMDVDMCGGAVVKMDNTGRGLLQLLRHLKRFTEVRGKLCKTPVTFLIYTNEAE